MKNREAEEEHGGGDAKWERKTSAPAIVLLCGLFFLSCAAAPAPPVTGTPVAVEAIPIHLNPEDPDQARLGELLFLQGFHLKSEDSRFTELSGLAMSRDGSMLYAVSDEGYWLKASVRHDADGRLTTIGPWTVTPLLTTKGRPVTGRLRDAEGLESDRGGSLIVAFEQIHRLWRYPAPPEAFTSAAETIPVPQDLENAPANGGAEAVTVLLDGQILILTEGYANPDGTLKGWLLRAETSGFEPLSLIPEGEFRPTGASTLRDGDVLVLERSYSLLRGAAARIRLIPGREIHPGARLAGREIARLQPPIITDNFEGIAVREDPALGTILYIVSDDNGNPLQRTLLLQFRLGLPPLDTKRDLTKTGIRSRARA